MQKAQDDTAPWHREVMECLCASISLGLPHILNIEWLIDRFEHVRRTQS
ncbi:hypothetical protein [uncultured Tateyamaria sp.]|nr:hypothetical protein [uncultured Tateyamaria sp.]